jgi:hypothetical protein
MDPSSTIAIFGLLQRENRYASGSRSSGVGPVYEPARWILSGDTRAIREMWSCFQVRILRLRSGDHGLTSKTGARLTVEDTNVSKHPAAKDSLVEEGGALILK